MPNPKRFLLLGGSDETQRQLALTISRAVRGEGLSGLVSQGAMTEAVVPFADPAGRLAYARAHCVLYGKAWSDAELRQEIPGLEVVALCGEGGAGAELGHATVRLEISDLEDPVSTLAKLGLSPPPGGPEEAPLDGAESIRELVSSCCSCGAEMMVGQPSVDPNRHWRSRASALKKVYRRLMLRHFLGQKESDSGLPCYPKGTADLAAVTCFFDPCSSRRRGENLRRFNEAFAATKVPLLTVVGEFPGAPRIPSPAYGEVLRVPCPSVLWQKERLLNLGLDRLLEQGFEKIAWVDADVLLEEPLAWGPRVSLALERHPLVQAFSYGRLVETGTLPSLGWSSVRYLEATGRLLSQERIYGGWRKPFGSPHGLSGYAWAARAEVLKRSRLYEAAVIGGGDKMMYVAACGSSGQLAQHARTLTRSAKKPCAQCGFQASSPAFAQHFLSWAGGWRHAIKAEADRLGSGEPAVGSVDQIVSVLPHGKGSRRWYMARREALLRFGYDPDIDLEDSQDCGLRWTPRVPSMHHSVLNYFFERQEDVD